MNDNNQTNFTVIDSDEVRAAKGYRETREKAHADRERSLVEILRRGREDGTFPLADPEDDVIAISALISRVLPLPALPGRRRCCSGRRTASWTLPCEHWARPQR